MRCFGRWGCLLALPVSLALGACGGDDPSGGARGRPGTSAEAAVPSDLARLVPANAWGIVYSPSADALLKRLNALMLRVDSKSNMDAVQLLTEIVGPDVAGQVDAARPLAVAFSFAGGEGQGSAATQRPSPTFILPMKDVAKAKQALGRGVAGAPEPVVMGSYMGLSSEPGFVAQAVGSKLLDGIPGGDLALRLELSEIAAWLRAKLGELVDESGPSSDTGPPSDRGPLPGDPQAGLSKMLGQLSAALGETLEQAERLDLGLWIEGGRLELEGGFTAKEGSALAARFAAGGDAAALAARLPQGDFPISLAASISFERFWDFFEPLMRSSLSASMPERAEAQERYFAFLREMYASTGDTMAGVFSLGDGGMRAVAVMSLKDSKAYEAVLDRLPGVMADIGMAGVKIESLPTAQVAGVTLRGWRMQMDMAAFTDPAGTPGGLPPAAQEQAQRMMEGMFGKDGFVMRMATVGDHALTVMGDDALVAAAVTGIKGGGKVPAGLVDVLQRAVGKPRFAMHMDLRGLLTFVQTFMEEAGAGSEGALGRLPPGPPVAVSLYLATQGRALRGGLSFDMGGLLDLVQAMSKRPAPR